MGSDQLATDPSSISIQQPTTSQTETSGESGVLHSVRTSRLF